MATDQKSEGHLFTPDRRRTDHHFRPVFASKLVPPDYAAATARLAMDRVQAMTPEQIERIARAHYLKIIGIVAERRPGAPFYSWEQLPDEQRSMQIEAIRASLAELDSMGLAIVPRTPDEAMTKRMLDCALRGGDVLACWRAALRP